MEFDGLEGEINGDTVGTCLSSIVDDSTVESHRYYLARRTMLEMLRDRGFIIPSTEIDLSLEDFRNSFGPKPDPEKLRISTSLRSDNEKKMLVVFCGPAMIKVSVIRGILSQIVNRESMAGLILVVQNSMTSQATKSLELQTFKVEVFQITDLLVNITKHDLKPKHRVLTEKDKGEAEAPEAVQCGRKTAGAPRIGIRRRCRKYGMPPPRFASECRLSPQQYEVNEADGFNMNFAEGTSVTPAGRDFLKELYRERKEQALRFFDEKIEDKNRSIELKQMQLIELSKEIDKDVYERTLLYRAQAEAFKEAVEASSHLAGHNPPNHHSGAGTSNPKSGTDLSGKGKRPRDF